MRLPSEPAALLQTFPSKRCRPSTMAAAAAPSTSTPSPSVQALVASPRPTHSHMPGTASRCSSLRNADPSPLGPRPRRSSFGSTTQASASGTHSGPHTWCATTRAVLPNPPCRLPRDATPPHVYGSRRAYPPWRCSARRAARSGRRGRAERQASSSSSARTALSESHRRPSRGSTTSPRRRETHATRCRCVCSHHQRRVAAQRHCAVSLLQSYCAR